MKTNLSRLPQFIIIAAITFLSVTNTNLSAQVTVGSDIAPIRAALLDLKMKQAGSVVSVTDETNETATGGLLLPRVRLVSTGSLAPLIPSDDADWIANTDNIKERLAGLTVYNINYSPPALLQAIYTWDGTHWTTSQINEVSLLVPMKQPAPFTFCETGSESATLTFEVSGGELPLSYQWYQFTSTNLHVTVGDSIKSNSIGAGGSYQSPSLVLGSGILKGVTDRATNCGFYRFYCVVKDAKGQTLTSDIAEVAVGCGAKNNDGDWLSFMCFNLGAEHRISINDQINRPLELYRDSATAEHYYTVDEVKIYGDLFQWGRIADGHEKRNSPNVAYSSSIVIDQGNRCGKNVNNVIVGDHRPVNQIHPDSAKWYGMFIKNANSPYNWTPADPSIALWRTSIVYEDPCNRYIPSTGGYQDSWHTGTDGMPDDAACTDPGAGWRLPSQSEWGEIYKGGVLAGRPEVATANSWKWASVNSSIKVSSSPYSSKTQYKEDRAAGYKIQPDNATTTLFLPAAGFRYHGDAGLYYQSLNAYYWSSSFTTGTSTAQRLSYNNTSVTPGNADYRAYGMAIRCIKST
jgi:uncharacterized protein (TIGR02145 family)